MRKALAFATLLLINCLLYASQADTAIIEITDLTLPSVYYQQVSYETPTKLVFKNLSAVDGSIYFHENVNLVAVEFPLLESCQRQFYFYRNTSLQRILAPKLNTVVNYLSVYGNTALTQLDICNLKWILPSDPSVETYYSIAGNTAIVDQQPFCFSRGAPTNLAISNDAIFENEETNSFIGRLSALGNGDDKLSFQLSIEPGDNEQFTIRNDSLLSAKTFDYESKNSYTIKIIVINQVAERSFKEFLIEIKPDLSVQDTTIIEIEATNLETVSYHQVQYTRPTKLIFKNLTTVTGNIYFHENVNLVAVEFPLLQSCQQPFIFSRNTSLQRILAPNLNTVVNYLSISGNIALTELDICNLKQILPSDATREPYYSIFGNTAIVDQQPFCFSTGAPTTLSLFMDSIFENRNAGSLVGRLSAARTRNDIIRFYLSDDPGDNEQFTIRGDSLLSSKAFDYESKNSYNIRIIAQNQLGEKIQKDFSIKIIDQVIEDTVVMIISDTTMGSIYYYQESFITPTKLQFKNLTAVNGTILFHQNTNLVGVDLPLLDSAGGHVYFHGNGSIHKINAPALRAVGDYLYIYGNTSLVELNICSLNRILPTDSTREPYYYIYNNNNLEYASTCLEKTNVIYVPVKSIVVKPAPNTLIGYFLADAATTDSVRYYFINEEGNETINPDFIIKRDSVFLRKEFASYTSTNFSFDINAIRVDKTQNKPTELSPSLAEKIYLKVNGNILNPIRYSNQWIGLGTTPASSAWENPGNWSSNVLPDANTDVTISGGNVVVGTNAICRSLTVKTAANIVVKPGFIVTITR